MKENLGIAVLAILRGLMIFVLVFGMCFIVDNINKDSNKGSNMSEDRFIKIQDWGDNFVMYDTETGVQYFSFGVYNRGGGITVLVDAEGKPLLYEGE